MLMEDSEGKLQVLLDKVGKENEKKGLLTAKRQNVWSSARKPKV